MTGHSAATMWTGSSQAIASLLRRQVSRESKHLSLSVWLSSLSFLMIDPVRFSL